MLDLETMQFEAGPTMGVPRGGAAAPLDADRVLVIGGSDNANGTYFASRATEILGATDE